ncbi:splicing regulator SDE2-like [Watersipora subatra]|uniref:splicing regulator SDE2-like n=1 Tax=Watersipora subatra TaxID=2589382 RepID=UPI00355C0EAF
MDDYYLVCNGRIVDKDEKQDEAKIYHVCYRLPGGKGGFGSMLRTIGAQIEKTTNREAMRDLSGRRMRDINNEKKLADWVAGAADREREQETRRQERLEKRRAEAEGRMHKFRDEKYMEQKEAVATNLDDALTQGLKRSAAGTSSDQPEKKGKVSIPASTSWAGIDLDDLSSSDDDEGSSVHQKTELEQLRESIPVRAELPKHEEESSEGIMASETATKLIGKENETNDTHISHEEKNKQPPSVDTIKPQAIDKSALKEEHMNNATASQEDTKEDSQRNKDGSEQNKDKSEQNKDESPRRKDLQPGNTESIDLDSHHSALELERYSLDHLKHELTRRGLKCGGSLKERAERLYSVKGLSPEQISPTLLAKKKK